MARFLLQLELQTLSLHLIQTSPQAISEKERPQW